MAARALSSGSISPAKCPRSKRYVQRPSALNRRVPSGAPASVLSRLNGDASSLKAPFAEGDPFFRSGYSPADPPSTEKTSLASSIACSFHCPRMASLICIIAGSGQKLHLCAGQRTLEIHRRIVDISRIRSRKNILADGAQLHHALADADDAPHAAAMDSGSQNRIRRDRRRQQAPDRSAPHRGRSAVKSNHPAHNPRQAPHRSARSRVRYRERKYAFS